MAEADIVVGLTGPSVVGAVIKLPAQVDAIVALGGLRLKSWRREVTRNGRVVFEPVDGG